MKRILIILFAWSYCFLFAGCSSQNIVSSKTDVGTENTVENELQQMENELPDIGSVVEDNWPDRIGRENENTTAQNLSFDIEISNPMILDIICVTESGKLDMEIISSDGEEIFHESDIQTESFEVHINSSGTYKVIMQLKEHTGSFWIEPRK
ncbi:MAG: hypothetical protein NC416_14840 [Eubacterium sp.]|nr:hypothetical protein [Eubacterium sp.]